MWENYSDNGKGLCVGFKSQILFNQLGGGGKVIYVSELHKIMPEQFHSHDQQIIYQIFYKEEKWSYEDEYRTHTFSFEPMTSAERIITVPPEAFSVIIIGNQMTEQDKIELREIIPIELQHIPIIEYKKIAGNK